jgi:hypothetical protein
VFKCAAADQVPAAGLKISAVFVVVSTRLTIPPAAITRPSLRRFSDCHARAVDMLAAADQEFEVGCQSAAWAMGPDALFPPAMRTRPSDS